MRDDESRLTELFEATRNVERAPNASRDELRYEVAKQLAAVGVLAGSVTAAKAASAATMVGGSGAKLSSLFAAASAKLAFGIVAGATVLGSIGYLVHDTSARRQGSPHASSVLTWTQTPATADVAVTPQNAAIASRESPPDSHEVLPAGATTQATSDQVAPMSTSARAFDVNRTKAAPAASQPQKDSLAEELALVRAAQSELNARNAGEALSLLGRYFRSFPRGTLVPEAQVARIKALCLSGHQAQAEREAQRFVRANPNSPLAARVRGACATP